MNVVATAKIIATGVSRRNEAEVPVPDIASAGPASTPDGRRPHRTDRWQRARFVT